MKIALVCDRWDARGGGLEIWAQQFVSGMRARGHQLHVVTFDAKSPCPCAELHIVEARPGKLARGDAVRAVVRELSADVVHDTGVGWTYDVLHPQAGSKIANRRRDLASRSPGERLLRHLRPASWRWRREVRELERRQYEDATGMVIAPSNMVAEHLKQLHRVRRERISVVPNGVDTERFSPIRLRPMRSEARRKFGFRDETVFLFAARNPVLKGIRPLFKAMRRTRGCQLLVIGAQAPEGKRDVDRIKFAGYLDDPLVALAAADAVIQPSYYDACSLTALEAWASGRPVVTTRWNGAAELMTDGVEGFCLDDPGEIPVMVQAMHRLLDPAERRRMGEAARVLAERYRFACHLDRIEDLYRSMRCHG